VTVLDIQAAERGRIERTYIIRYIFRAGYIFAKCGQLPWAGERIDENPALTSDSSRSREQFFKSRSLPSPSSNLHRTECKPKKRKKKKGRNDLPLEKVLLRVGLLPLLMVPLETGRVN
jgi:hypothetical protein